MRFIFEERRLVMLGLMLAALIGFMGAAVAAPAQETGAGAGVQSKSQQVDAAPDYAALAALLEDPKSRAVLIKELQRLASEQPTAGFGKTTPKASTATLASSMAVDTLSVFHAIHDEGIKALVQFNRLLHIDPASWDWSTFGENVWRMALLFVFAYGSWLLYGHLIRPVLVRLDRWSTAASARQHLLRLFLSLTLIGALGVLGLGLIFITGNFLSATLAGDDEPALWRQTLFFNAFVTLEFVRMVIALVLTPSYDGLHLFPIKADQAKFWMRRSSGLIRFLGYGLMWLVPVVERTWGIDAAQSVVWTLALVGLVYALHTVFSQRHILRDALLPMAERHPNGMISWLLGALAHTWHLLAALYIGMVFLVGLTRPTDALPFIVRATGYTFLIIAGALLLSAISVQLLGGEVRLKEHHRMRVPLLERRLNTYLPWLVHTFRLTILLVAIALILSVWHVTNAFNWLGTNPGQQFLSTVFDVAFILLGTVIVWLVLSSLIEMKLNGVSSHMPSARMQTLLTLFRNIIAIALLAMAVMMVLSEIGVNIGPLLAGAGVLGLAIGFGAQKLVQDVITGVFIQLENAINTGDTITVGGITGTAERLTIRSVGLRDLNGTYHIVPFSAVEVVSNYMRGYAYHKAEYRIAYRESIDEAITYLEAAFEELKSDPAMRGKILEPIHIPGVTELGASSVNIRVMIKTTPGDQWAVGRAYNRLVKMHFDAAGIEIPFPHTTIYFGEDKSGKAPPVYVQNLGGTPESAG
ncbi:mechanosensitive ion channel domain-containing protein [Halothiobacillus sp. 15-55-196]|uniref:mechanosensitive ion channel domain-containing protein n=1 Tax=Halothiobacillus sp. 15-55-196 TaxID=1970382 RepID=UPI0025C2D969|nr:mechanosensitive ion channel domain-containing protein [Halothiobacillus sp. 15-55-196]